MSADSAAAAPLRWGVMSTAWISTLVVPQLQASAAAEVLAVGSRDLARAQAYAREQGVPRAHGSYEELLADPELDAIYVALPNALHAEAAQAALTAGKHVLCEKPLTVAPADARALFALAAERGLVLMEGFMYRHHPQTLRLVELLAEGTLGRLLGAQCIFYTRAREPEANIRHRRELGGGALLDVGAYCVSLAGLLAQAEPEAVATAWRPAVSGVDEAFSGMLRYGGGLVVQFHCGIDAELSTHVTLVGSDATLTIANPWLPDVDAPIWTGARPASQLVVWHGSQATPIPTPGANPYRLQADQFAAAAAGREAPLIGAEESLRNVGVLARLAAGAGLELPGPALGVA